MSIDQTEWKQEQQRVNNVIDQAKEKMKTLKASGADVKSDVLHLRRNFWDDVTVNFDEPDDIIETYASITQQAGVLSERERSHGLVNQQLKTLERITASPYFGRIDFHENGEKTSEPIYIGIASLLDRHDNDFLVYDWRAPVSSLYYDYPPGPGEYDTPEGTIAGNIDLKRQYVIKDGHIDGMFDTGLTIGDGLLQQVLGQNASQHMQNIVATIQQEQNRIIRNSGNRILIVQGVAGSGKTSAALQRVAYLLYRHRGVLQSENILLFSPNNIFTSFVSSVLPELGENNMQQSTFQEYLEHRLRDMFTIEDAFAQQEALLTIDDPETYKQMQTSIQFKASLDFKDMIDAYLRELSEAGIVFQSLVFRDNVLVSSEQMRQQFYAYDSNISIPNRMEMLVEWLKTQINRQARIELKKNWVEDEIELLDPEDYRKVYQKMQKEQPDVDTFADFETEQTMLAKLVVKRAFRPLLQTVKQLDFIDGTAIYKRLFTKCMPQSASLPDDWETIGAKTIERISQGQLAYEDATPYLYLKDHIEGRRTNTAIRHVFIDEAQDYSPFQFAFIRFLFPYSKMTILGDRHQAIFSHAIHSLTERLPQLFPKDEQETFSMNRSYRSTRQIVEFTRELLPDGGSIEAFNREGSRPTLTTVSDTASLRHHVVEQIRCLQTGDHQTIAVICKTFQEAESTYEALRDDIDLNLIDKETVTYEAGVLVIPAYLAKGIEFDAVIIYNASAQQYAREDERRLFYTACTRAMHELYINALVQPTHLLDDVSHDKFVSDS
ncbi:RNA polymerase recycling motor HelD [Tuberibacillus sp. Marseille-P3662]|uniref:RNA polymerase recycling motor HelD n=1 Tax=Tuberibacillus sp. Marseille-P3662 TaxID=1965358 RepID=UPI000A1CEC96|nr:RNA polymerase recycling motor HelD [Tuberibacillus sp. Marseille-P3662]